MRLLVTLKNFENIIDPESIQRLRQIVGKKMQEILGSGKVIESGVFSDARGGFFLLEVDSAVELTRLLFPMHDFCHIETHPVYSFEELGQLFSEAEAAEGAML